MVARRPVGKRSVDSDGTVRVRGRAANGEGSVYFAADGRWRATYRIPGEGRPRSVSGATRDKAIAARDRRLAQLAEEPLTPIAAAGTMSGDTPIGELARWWLTNVQTPSGAGHHVGPGRGPGPTHRGHPWDCPSRQVEGRAGHRLAGVPARDPWLPRRWDITARPWPRSSTRPSSSA